MYIVIYVEKRSDLSGQINIIFHVGPFGHVTLWPCFDPNILSKPLLKYESFCLQFFDVSS